MGDAELRECFVKTTPLSREEQGKLHYFLLAAMRAREWEWFQFRDGVVSRDVYRAYIEVVGLHLGIPRTRRWWSTVGRIGFNPEFVAEVDAFLAGRPPISYFEDILTFDTRSGNGTRRSPRSPARRRGHRFAASGRSVASPSAGRARTASGRRRRSRNRTRDRSPASSRPPEGRGRRPIPRRQRSGSTNRSSSAARPSASGITVTKPTTAPSTSATMAKGTCSGGKARASGRA